LLTRQLVLQFPQKAAWTQQARRRPAPTARDFLHGFQESHFASFLLCFFLLLVHMREALSACRCCGVSLGSPAVRLQWFPFALFLVGLLAVFFQRPPVTFLLCRTPFVVLPASRVRPVCPVCPSACSARPASVRLLLSRTMTACVVTFGLRLKFFRRLFLRSFCCRLALRLVGFPVTQRNTWR